ELGAFGRPPRMVAPDDCKSQAEYIGYFDDAIAVMQTQAALERIAYEVCADSAAENIDYLEVRWAPRLHLRGGLTVPQVIEGVLAGLAAGPMRAVAIVCAMRQHSVEDNVALAREAGRYAGRGLAGVVRAGGGCTISSDARTVDATSVSHEFGLAAAMGMPEAELRACNETAYDARFDAPT